MTEQNTRDPNSLSGQISQADLARLAERERATGGAAGTGAQPSGAGLDAISPPDFLDDLRETVDEEEAPLSWAEQRILETDDRLVVQRKNVQDARNRLTLSDITAFFQMVLLTVGVYVLHTYRSTLRTIQWLERHPRTRGVLMVITSVIILAVVGIVISSEVRADIRAKQGPFLDDAVVAPHDLKDRVIPSYDQSAASLLPATIGDYELTSSAVTPDNPSSLMIHCQIGVRPNYNGVYNCSLMYGALDRAAGRYLGSRALDVAVSQYATEDAAQRSMVDMLHYARAQGEVGNFAVLNSGGPVDYFYSATRSGWYSLTWAHDRWIFTISTSSFKDLETAVLNFPY